MALGPWAQALASGIYVGVILGSSGMVLHKLLRNYPGIMVEGLYQEPRARDPPSHMPGGSG